MSEIDAIVLAGGLGTRLREVSGDIPKPLVPVAADGRTVFLDHLLTWLALYPVRRVILSVCYRPPLFHAFAATRQFPFELEIVAEAEPLGTGGAVAFAAAQTALSQPFAVLNGDTYNPFDLAAMVQALRAGEMPAMLSMAHVPDTSRYGRVERDGDHVTAFTEKAAASGSGWINAGCYLLGPALLPARSDAFSLEQVLLPELAARRQLGCFETESAFIDIGIPADYRRFVAAVAAD
jgi:NDP-sugar pyrophosphorylase family protein